MNNLNINQLSQENMPHYCRQIGLNDDQIFEVMNLLKKGKNVQPLLTKTNLHKWFVISTGINYNVDVAKS